MGLIPRALRAILTRCRDAEFVVRRMMLQASTPGLSMHADGGQIVCRGASIAISDGGAIALGRQVHVGAGAEISARRGKVVIGDRTFIGRWGTIVARHDIAIGSDCLIAERVTIRDQDHEIRGSLDVPIAQAGFDVGGIHIGDGAWVGAGAAVLKGVRIGRGAVVAANAVVTRDVADFEIVGGVPARRIGTRTSTD